MDKTYVYVLIILIIIIIILTILYFMKSCPKNMNDTFNTPMNRLLENNLRDDNETNTISIDSFVETPEYNSEFGGNYVKQTMLIDIPPNSKDIETRIIRKYPNSQVTSQAITKYGFDPDTLCVPIKVTTVVGIIDTKVCLGEFINLAKKVWEIYKNRKVTPKIDLPVINILPAVEDKQVQDIVWDRMYNWRTRSWGPFKVKLTGKTQDSVWLTFDLYIIWDYGGVLGTEPGKPPHKNMYINNGEVIIENVNFTKSWGECTITGESGKPINISKETDTYYISSVRIKLTINAKSMFSTSHNWTLMWDITSAGQASSFTINQGKIIEGPADLKPDIPVKTTENAPDSKVQTAVVKTSKKRILPVPPTPK